MEISKISFAKKLCDENGIISVRFLGNMDVLPAKTALKIFIFDPIPHLFIIDDKP